MGLRYNHIIGFPQIDEKIRSKISQHLEDGEEPIHTCRPKGGILIKPLDIIFIPLSIILAIAAYNIAALAFESEGMMILKIFSVILILIAFYFLVGRFIDDMVSRKYTIYAITNKRIIIKSGPTQDITRIYEIRKIIGLMINEKKNGFGTIILDKDRFMDNVLPLRYSRTFKISPKLVMIPNAKEIFDYLKGIREY